MNNEEKILKILSEMQTDISNMKTDISDMKTDISNMKTDISNMKTDISNMKTDISNMKTDISNMKTDISNLQSDTAAIKQDVKDLKISTDEGFRAVRSEFVDVVETTSNAIHQLEHTVKDIETVTAQNAYDVQLMKRSHSA